MTQRRGGRRALQGLAARPGAAGLCPVQEAEDLQGPTQMKPKWAPSTGWRPQVATERGRGGGGVQGEIASGTNPRLAPSLTVVMGPLAELFAEHGVPLDTDSAAYGHINKEAFL